MDSKYIITGETLTNIADAIRAQENTKETIPTTDFAKHIAAIEPSVEDYMRIFDLSDYTNTINENNYTEYEINKCEELLHYCIRLEEKNG